MTRHVSDLQHPLLSGRLAFRYLGLVRGVHSLEVMNILPTREELLAAILDIYRLYGPITYRYATEEAANNHLKEEAQVLRERR